MLNKRLFDNAVGKICEVLIPLKHKYYIGKGKSVAICTLSSIDLLKEISNSVDIMNRILIVGRLLSENEGIDTIIKFVLDHTELHHIIICGKEVKGHHEKHATSPAPTVPAIAARLVIFAIISDYAGG
jgi:tetrahydromethanopterin S-methyltransferase subunit A